MKKLMVAIAAAAISFAGFADDTNNWFTAGFGAEASSSGGAWSPAPSSLTWDENILVLEDVDAQAPVTFGATESKASTNDENTIVFDTTVLFQGFEELPAIDTDAKAGVCALTGGDYYVVAKVDGKNAWVDTGFAADFESAVKVKVTVANGKAVYSFGANSTEPLDLVNAEFQEVCYSGNGSVSALAADTILAGVAITLPTIDGLTVTCDKVRAAVGESVLLKFAAGTKIPNRTEALYEVKANGELEFADDGDEPAGQDPGAKIGTAIYLTFAEAYGAAKTSDTIELCSDQMFGDVASVEKDVTVDINGFRFEINDDLEVSGALTITDSKLEESAGLLVLGAEVDLSGTLDISEVLWENVEGGYVTGEGELHLGISPNLMFAKGALGEDMVIVYDEKEYFFDSEVSENRYVTEGEVAYGIIAVDDLEYEETFDSVQAAIDATDEVYLCFDIGASISETELTFKANTIVYAYEGETDLEGINLVSDAGDVVFDASLGGWKVSGEQPTYVAQIGDVKYETLADALEAAKASETVKLLADVTMTKNAEIAKAIAIDLNAKTVTFDGCDGFYFTADGVISNGTVTMNAPATDNRFAVIGFEDANGLVKDVTVNAGNAKDGVVCCSAYNDFNGKTVVCENVDVTGSGRNFYAETAAMTLDADCSATQVDAYTGDPAYSTALAAGWLGQLTVNGGEYTADANVVGTMSSPATITLNAGTYSGNFNYVPVAESYKSMGDHVITKNEDVELAAPAGYEWSVAVADMQKLVKTYTITYVDAVVTNGMTKYTVETETFALPTAADVEERSGGQFKGWTNEVGTAVTEVVKGTTGDLTFYAVWEAAGVFYPTYIDQDDADLKEKFNDWATNKNGGDRDGASANIDAFLLNCASADVETAKAAFKITSIVNVDGLWVVKACEKGQNEVYGNGYINIISVKADKFPTAGEGSDFFQATLTIKPTLK